MHGSPKVAQLTALMDAMQAVTFRDLSFVLNAIKAKHRKAPEYSHHDCFSLIVLMMGKQQ
jgi:hypothetical protein